MAGEFGRIHAGLTNTEHKSSCINADVCSADAKKARELGAEAGIGLCRTEHMFLKARIGAFCR
ncbi:MAG: putative PEP-binding protein [Eubacterium ramulus]